MSATTIQISYETWNRLKDLKQKPSDTFDDVINRLLDAFEKD